jgi:nitroreductase
MEDGVTRSEARHAVELIRTLSAVRQFTDQPLPEAAVKDIFEVIRWSGSASNRQQFQVLWIEERHLLQKVAGLEGHAKHLAGAAAGAVIVTWMERDELNAFDEGRISERIMLAAHAHGIASCIGWLRGDGEAARKLLDLAPDRTVRTTVSLGYAAPGAKRGRRRKPMEELVRRVP